MPPWLYPPRCTDRLVAAVTMSTTSLIATTWSVRVRSSPPASRSGEPKSITHGSMPASYSAATALVEGETSQTSAEIIIGGTSTIGGRTVSSSSMPALPSPEVTVGAA